jgi:hypothetical protein
LNGRPAAGSDPSVAKKSGDTRITGSTSVAPASPIVAVAS